jgi:2-dehydro-3-deoxygalactonokinase
MTTHPALLGIDWGTSNRRAYLIDATGALLRSHADDQGLLAVQGRFGPSLQALRREMAVDDQVPTVMSGMVGSANGWHEVAYLDLDVPLDHLPGFVAPVPGQAGCAIVPGYRTRGAQIDVMRGEEVQLLGAVLYGVRDDLVLLPGTHSKWVRLHDGRIDQFSTFMTGELFAMLAKGGTLGTLLADAPTDESAFTAGLDAARAQLPLTQSLFGVRARVVTGDLPAPAARGFVSGLLIGAEFVAALAQDGAFAQADTVFIVGSHDLSARYAGAARHFNLAPVALDADALFIAALKQFLVKAK